jgi:hypothetical protein
VLISSKARFSLHSFIIAKVLEKLEKVEKKTGITIYKGADKDR